MLLFGLLIKEISGKCCLYPSARDTYKLFLSNTCKFFYTFIGKTECCYNFVNETHKQSFANINICPNESLVVT